MSATVLRLGSYGPEVARWQTIIGVVNDSRFGPKTEISTKAWQAARGLTADGIVGDKTWARAQLLAPPGPPAAPTASLHLSVIAAFIPFTSRFEGVVNHLYLDVLGLVTVGIGNLVDPLPLAMNLPFVEWLSGARATKDMIASEWKLIKSHTELAKLGHRAASGYCKLRLPPDGIERLVGQRLDQNTAYLARRFPGFWGWCADAQLATEGMAWAAGAGFKFPKLEAALLAQDFAAAAEHCHLNEAGNPGLVPRNVAQKQLYLNAQRVMDEGLDRSVLLYNVRA